MAKTKGKVKEESKTTKAVSASKAATPRLSCSIWEREIAALQTTKFANIEDATREVIKRVVSRLGGDPESRAKIEEFLFDVIDTDPGLKEELRKVLNIA